MSAAVLDRPRSGAPLASGGADRGRRTDAGAARSTAELAARAGRRRRGLPASATGRWPRPAARPRHAALRLAALPIAGAEAGAQALVQTAPAPS